MIFFSFLIENHNIVTPHLNRLDETDQMRGHTNVFMQSRINKNFPYLSLNMPSYLFYSILSHNLGTTD